MVVASLLLAGLLSVPGGGRAESSLCTPALVDSHLREFVRAFNRGDTARLDTLFARGREFQWYSSNAPGLRAGATAFRRDTLIGYFRRRHVLRDRLKLLSLRFRGSATAAHSNFELRLERRAADYRGGRPLRISAKGAAVCDERGTRFIVMSLGGAGSG